MMSLNVYRKELPSKFWWDLPLSANVDAAFEVYTIKILIEYLTRSQRDRALAESSNVHVALLNGWLGTA